MNRFTYIAAEQEEGMRLDLFIASRLPQVTRSMADKLCEEKLVCKKESPLSKAERGKIYLTSR